MIDPSIPLSVKQPEFMSPAQMITLRNLARQSQLQELQMAEAQRQQQVRGQTQDIYQQNVDPQTGTLSLQGLQQLAGVDPAAFEAAGAHRNVALSHMSVENQRRLQMAQDRKKAGEEIGRDLLNSYDLAFQASPNEQTALQAATTSRNEAVDELWRSGRASMLGLTDEDRQKWTSAPPDIKGWRAKLSTPEQLAQREERTRTPFQRDLERLQKMKPGDPGYAEMKKRVERETAPTQTMISLTGAGQLSGDALTLAVDQYLAGDSTAAQGYARNAQMKSQFMNRLAERAKEKGMSGADVAARVAEFQGTKAGQRVLGGRTANIEMAVTEAQNMAPLALEASEKVDRTRFPTLNSLLLAADRGVGGEDVVRLGVATNSLINIYARAISPTGVPTVSDKDHARELLSAAWSKGQYRAGIDQLMKELAAARKAPEQVRESMRAGTSGKLTPDEETELQQLRQRFGR